MRKFLERRFGLKKRGSSVQIELIAGLTTFITMVYVITVNPAVLSLAGMDKQAVFVATILAAATGTLIMGLFANVPFAVAPGMGLNAFFTFTVVIAFKIPWEQALAMVFICGIINIVITATKIRKMLIIAIPESMQYAITAGIGLFIAYIGFKNAHFLDFTTEGSQILSSVVGADGKIMEVFSRDVIPTITKFNDPVSFTALAGLVIMIILMLMKVRGAIIIGIISTTLIGLATQVTTLPEFTLKSFSPPSLMPTLLKLDFSGLFAEPQRFFGVLSLIMAFSLTDTFDTIGTFLGTGRKAGIFDEKDEEALEKGKGFSSRLDKALFADACATSIGSIFGTSNTTTYVESASGIAAGGKTGLTAVFVALFFLAALFLAPFALMVPAAATAPALIVVGILMMSTLHKIDWHKFDEAVPGFFITVMMAFTYNIANGIAAGLIFYVIVMLIQKKWRKIHPLLYFVTLLFIANFVFTALK